MFVCGANPCELALHGLFMGFYCYSSKSILADNYHISNVVEMQIDNIPLRQCGPGVVVTISEDKST